MRRGRHRLTAPGVFEPSGGGHPGCLLACREHPGALGVTPCLHVPGALARFWIKPGAGACFLQ